MLQILVEAFYVAVYSALGIVLMMLGNYLVDLVVPCCFPEEIRKGNEAVGWISAGSFIGIGTILRAAFASPAAEELNDTLLYGLCSSMVYYILGIVFFILGYIAILLLNKRYNLSQEIGKGNKAAGIMVCGIFIGLALLISGVIA